MDRKILQEILIDASPKYVFHALINPSLIKQWWYAQSVIVIPEVNGIYAITWGENIDDVDYTTVSKITQLEFGKHLTMINEIYYSPHGSLPFDAQLKVTFTLKEKGSGTLLTVLQEGIPKDSVADEFFQGSVEGWKSTLLSLKNVTEDEAASVRNMSAEE